MKLHAGSLYKNCLVLYGEDVQPHIIEFMEGMSNLQWDMYCNEIDFQAINDEECIITFNNMPYSFPYWVTNEPMRFLGFSKVT